MPTSAATVMYAAVATRLNKMGQLLPTVCQLDRPIACSTRPGINDDLIET